MKINIQFLALFLLLLSCASPPKKVTSAEVLYNSEESTSTAIVLQSRGYGNKLQTALADAEQRAFTQLLFEGIPGYRLGKPLLRNASQTRDSNVAYFNTFFKNEKYKKYIIKTEYREGLSEAKDVASNQKYADVTLSVNVESLRRDLENKFSSQKFGL